MSLWLTPAELVELTGFKQRGKQRLELARQGLKFTVRSDGFPLVDRSLFQASGERLTKNQRRREPNFTVIGRA